MVLRWRPSRREDGKRELGAGCRRSYCGRKGVVIRLRRIAWVRRGRREVQVIFQDVCALPNDELIFGAGRMVERIVGLQVGPRCGRICAIRGGILWRRGNDTVGAPILVRTLLWNRLAACLEDEGSRVLLTTWRRSWL